MSAAQNLWYSIIAESKVQDNPTLSAHTTDLQEYYLLSQNLEINLSVNITNMGQMLHCGVTFNTFNAGTG